MRVGRKLFPYPILNKNSSLSTYINSSFSFSYIQEITEESLLLKQVKIELNNEYLADLSSRGLIEFILIVECSSTIFREKYKISRTPKNLSIPIDLLDDKVQISCFGYAKDEVNSFTHQSFHKDYQAITFEIQPHDLLAIDDGFEFKVISKEVEDNQVSSIFVVVQDILSSSETIQVILDQRNIRIILPKDSYDQYDVIKIYPGLKYSFFSTLLIPALSYSIEMVKQKGYEDSMNEYDWLLSIANSYKEVYKKDLETEIDNMNSVEVAQRLLGSPAIKTINELNRIVLEGANNDYE